MWAACQYGPLLSACTASSSTPSQRADLSSDLRLFIGHSRPAPWAQNMFHLLSTARRLVPFLRLTCRLSARGTSTTARLAGLSASANSRHATLLESILTANRRWGSGRLPTGHYYVANGVTHGFQASLIPHQLPLSLPQAVEPMQTQNPCALASSAYLQCPHTAMMVAVL